MNKSKLFQLIGALSKNHKDNLVWELKNEGLHDKEGLLLKLFSTACQSIENNDVVSKKEMFQKLFPEREFSQYKLRDLMHRLTQIIENRLAWDVLSEKPFLKQRLLLEFIANDPAMENLLHKESNRFIKKLNGEKNKDSQHYLLLSEINKFLYYHPFANRYDLGEPALPSVSQNLDSHYFLEKLKVACEMAARKNILKEKNELLLVEEIRSEILSDKKSNYSILHLLYAKIHALLSCEDGENYLSGITGLFYKKTDEIPEADRIIIYQHLQNHFIKKYESGKLDYLHNLFELYKFGLERNIICPNGQMTDTSFTNIGLTAITLGEMKWCRSFINDYEFCLAEEIRDIATLFLQINMDFHKQRYEKLIDMEIKREVPVPYKLRMRVVKLKSSYELFDEKIDFDEIYKGIHSFEMFIEREQQLAKIKLEPYTNLVMAVKLLIKAKTALPSKKQRFISKAKKIASTNACVAREWAIMKINEFEEVS